MFAIIYLVGTFIADLLKSRRRLEVENLFLRHQLNIILRRPPQRLRLRQSDRALMVWMMRLWASLLAARLNALRGGAPVIGAADVGAAGLGKTEKSSLPRRKTGQITAIQAKSIPAH